jgi:hypothetical protein
MDAQLDDDAIAELPPEMPGGLTFHLPMEIAALRDAGADEEHIDRLRHDRLVEAWSNGLVDPPLYRWAVERYTDTARQLLSDDAAAVSAALDDIAPLADGLAGAAFHGLIRLGYGVWRADAGEVARGLAYLRTRRQVLAAATGGSTAERPPLERDLPPADGRDGVTVFDMLDLAAGTGRAHVLDPRAGAPRALAVAAAALVRRNPSSFVAVHAVTGLHALCELHAAVSDEPFAVEQRPETLSAWWSAYALAAQACRMVVDTTPPEALAAFVAADGPVADLDHLVRASVASAETHDVKLAVSLRRLAAFGVLTPDEALQTGLARLAAGQLL